MNRQKLILSMVIGLVLMTAIKPSVVSAQWVTVGNDILNKNSGKVGIGTSNPIQKLEVSGNIGFTAGADRFIAPNIRTMASTGDNLFIKGGDAGSGPPDFSGGNLYLDGGRNGGGPSPHDGYVLLATKSNVKSKVGIGTSSPGEMLDVNGNIRVNQRITTSFGDLHLTSLTNDVDLFNGSSSHRLNIFSGSDNKVVLNSAGNSYFNGGKVGVGTESPSQMLEVNGGMRMNTATAMPTCNDTTRGTMWFTMGIGVSKDSLQVCAQGVGGTDAWRTVY